MERVLPHVRCYTPAERWTDGIINVGGTLLALIGATWLLLNASQTANHLSLFVYCFGLIAMLGASTLYHLTPSGAAAKEMLCRIDYAAIFVMIAGTYTPFVVNRLDVGTADVVVPMIWLGAAGGLILKLCLPQRFEAMGAVLYLAFGWAAVTLAAPLSQAVGVATLILLVTGGVTYSIGVTFHVLQRLPFHNAIWHAFVFAAAGQHFASVAAEFVR
jgi:hemolysin III